MRYALRGGKRWLEDQKAWHSKQRSQALFFVGGEMERRGKFVGVQGLTLDVLVVSDHIFLSEGDTKWDQWNWNIASLTPESSS
jgi:hypothetical protein